jgi:hypothetical protein
MGQPKLIEWELEQEEVTDEDVLGDEDLFALPFVIPGPEELEL